MTLKLQAMDQGVIANLKKNYTKCILNVARMEARKAPSVMDIIKEIKIFDAILHAKVAWEGVSPECIQRCFKQSGVMDPIEMASPQPSPTSLDQENDPEFDTFFQELLYIPWDQYLAMDEELSWNSWLEHPMHRLIPLKIRIQNPRHVV